MPSHDFKNFDQRLVELNNWQIEQQKKLKAFQEAQKKLLDLEHQKIFNSSSNQNIDSRCSKCEENVSSRTLAEATSKGNINIKNQKGRNDSEAFPSKMQLRELKEPKSSLLVEPYDYSSGNESANMWFEGQKSDGTKQSKSFLKRGDGLARFRMTLDDFKGPPKIYKDGKIKTYLKSKPGLLSKNTTNNLTFKSSKHDNLYRMPVKPQFDSLPKSNNDIKIKLYNPAKNFETKQCPVIFNGNKRIKNVSLPKAPKQNLFLKSCEIATEWYGILKGKEKFCTTGEKIERENFTTLEQIEKENGDASEHVGKKNDAALEQIEDFTSMKNENDIGSGHCGNERNGDEDFDRDKKKDEKELRIFEILEQKIDDSSFCSSSSFVDKLLGDSVCSTPSKQYSEKDLKKKSYVQGLKFLRSQFLDEEQIKKFDDLDEFSFDNEQELCNNIEKNTLCDRSQVDKFCNNDETEEQKDVKDGLQRNNNQITPTETDNLEILESLEEDKFFPANNNINKTHLEEHANNLKKKISEEDSSFKEKFKEENSTKDLSVGNKVRCINQQEMALKLQRKGLQDNVKQILNWEGSFKKKQFKRVTKKIKPKPIKTEKSKSVENDQKEKSVVFDGALLKLRLDELEKEIDIFRKENKNLDKIRKECNEERMKLSKEKKQFEKQMQEEKEKFEMKIVEEQKKLQKERNVFEKYYKQVKNQPSKQERQEILSLKKELEKLTETLTTKESRWGAGQARLRNQIKALEKENIELKNEIEKYKKHSSIKKVTFDNGRNLNTKIIHVINSELGKLKSGGTGTANSSSKGKNQSLSSRIDRKLERPIRRIKSAPNIKRPIEIMGIGHTDFPNEFDEKALGSVSTDSGIETNEARYGILQKLNGINYDSVREKNRVTGSGELSTDNCNEYTLTDSLRRKTNLQNSPESDLNDCLESVVSEAIFERNHLKGINLKLLGNKERSKRLNRSSYSDEELNDGLEDMVRIPRESSSDGTSSESEETEETEAGFRSRCEEREEQEAKKDKQKPKDTESTDSVRNEFTNYSKKCMLAGDSQSNEKFTAESKLNDQGIREKILEDGGKEIYFPNGNVKKIFPGSKIIKMIYYNGDIKETNILEGSEKYYYAETKTWHTTYKDGFEVLEFPNGQTERRHPNGSTEISFPNGCVRYCDSHGRDEWRFLDGSVIKTGENGHKILLMPNGQKEIHTKEFKRREYPDGTIKILYADGTQETRYATGRVRLKSKEGNLVMDSGGIR